MIEKINKWLPVVNLLATVAIILVLVGGNNQSAPQAPHKLGSPDYVTNYTAVETSQGLLAQGSTTLLFTLKNGSTGTSQAQTNRGLCFIYPYAATIVASSTVTVDCQATAASGTAGAITPLTGVQANDIVVATLSTTTQGTIAIGTGGLVLSGASASTTAGYITLRITNLTGTTFTWPTTGAATGTAYYISGR